MSGASPVGSAVIPQALVPEPGTQNITFAQWSAMSNDDKLTALLQGALNTDNLTADQKAELTRFLKEEYPSLTPSVSITESIFERLLLLFKKMGLKLQDVLSNQQVTAYTQKLDAADQEMEAAKIAAIFGIAGGALGLVAGGAGLAARWGSAAKNKLVELGASAKDMWKNAAQKMTPGAQKKLDDIVDASVQANSNAVKNAARDSARRAASDDMANFEKSMPKKADGTPDYDVALSKESEAFRKKYESDESLFNKDGKLTKKGEEAYKAERSTEAYKQDRYNEFFTAHEQKVLASYKANQQGAALHAAKEGAEKGLKDKDLETYIEKEVKKSSDNFIEEFKKPNPSSGQGEGQEFHQMLMTLGYTGPQGLSSMGELFAADPRHASQVSRALGESSDSGAQATLAQLNQNHEGMITTANSIGGARADSLRATGLAN